MSLKLLYFSCHETLEYDELKIFKELGFEVFSLGHYLRCDRPIDDSRGALPLNNHDLYESFCHYHPIEARLQPAQRYKMNLNRDFIRQFDIIYNVFYHENITGNWSNIYDKPVFHRTIGLSIPYIENCLHMLHNHGVKLIGYSEAEAGVPGYSGRDLVIRQPIDENIFTGWEGNDIRVLTVTKAMKKRAHHCRFKTYEEVTDGLPRSLIGLGNEDISYAKNNVPFYEMLKAMRASRVNFVTCSAPGTVTYSLAEALVMGMPIVSIGPKLGQEPGFNTFENHKFVELCSDNVDELREYIQYLFKHEDFAKDLGDRNRQSGIATFGYRKIKDQYKRLFEESLCTSLN